MALIDRNIVAYYKLDTNSTTQPDSVNSNDGTVNGDAVYTAAGKINGAYDFGGVNGFIEVPHHSTINFTNKISVSMWINRATTGTDWFFTKKVMPFNNGFAVQLASNDLWFYGNAASVIGSAIGFMSNDDNGNWVHFVFVYDAGIGYVSWYKNGVLVKGGIASPVSLETTAAFKIGGWDGTYANSFDGIMDEIALFNDSLEQSDVTELYNNGDGLQYPFLLGGNGYLINSGLVHNGLFNGRLVA